MKTKIHKIIVLAAACMAMADASGQNYVKEDTWLDRGGTIKTTTYQYLDGLGRKSQTATNAINTSGNYVHSLQTYDTNGRLSSQWLPAVGTSSPDCLSASAFGSCSQSTYGDSYAYTTNHYDALGSVTAIDEAGNAWHTEGKQTQTTYDTNVAGEVRLYTATATGSLAKNGFHPEETLTKISTTDADGRTAITYKDFLGRTVLERQTSNSDSLDTYYVYNERGQLGFVLSPGYQESGKKAIYGYGYIYDSHGRLTKKSLPQSEYTQYWYDSEGRLTGEQTQMMRERNLRRFFLYEEYGRVAVQGLCGAQQDFPSHTVTFSTTGNSLFGSGYAVASNGTVTNPMLESVSYYDEYSYIYTPLFATIGSFADSIRVNDSRFGQMTGKVECCSNGQLLFSGFAYDHRKNLICKTEALGDRILLVTRTERSFTGKPQFTYSTLTCDGVTTTANSEYVLADSSDLTVSVKMTVNGGTSVTISDFTYDDLGRVVRNTRGGNAGDVAYDYNLRGWTTEIDGKGFHEWLNYTDGSSTPYYSGNISSQHWKASNESFQRNYKFTYDGFGRMLRGDYHDNQSGKNNNYSEILGEYKANGNFRRLQRYGQKGAGGNFGKIDNLHLYFDYNRLKAVREDADPIYGNSAFHFNGSYLTTSEDQQYGYYDDGSLKWDSNKGISHIAYTPQGYPLRVQFRKGHTTEYVYTCDGRRMCTVHRTAMPNITVAFGDTLHLDATNTLSCDTTEYFGDFVFEDGQLSKYLFDGGYCTFTSATGQPTYHYFTCDHQGNVRAVVRQDGTIEQINHYYPLGGIFVGVGTNDSFQKYKYNGKELDRMHGLNFYDYGARQYDPILGRFTQMDPLCEKYYNFHPYAYCKNNPIRFVDNNGERPTPYEAALMAAHVYGGKNASKQLDMLAEARWFPSNYNTSISMDYSGFTKNGLHSELFQRTVDGQTEYAYVFAGTNPISIEDWVENVAQIAGLSSQYNTAIYNARTLSEEIGSNELTFVGHSLGGGEAAASSMATGRAAITFNPASVSKLTSLFHELGKTDNITNYRTVGLKIGKFWIGGDPLSNFQDNIGMKAPGSTFYIPIGLTDPFSSHSINTFLNPNFYF